MQFLKRLLGIGGADKAPPPSAGPPASDAAPAMITVFDGYGRAMQIPREEWRTNVLPGQFRERWDKPDELADAVTQALCTSPSPSLPTLRRGC
jgi:hypothetical protein